MFLYIMYRNMFLNIEYTNMFLYNTLTAVQYRNMFLLHARVVNRSLSEINSGSTNKRKLNLEHSLVPGTELALGPNHFNAPPFLEFLLEENDLMLKTAISSLSCIGAERVNHNDST